MNKKIKCSVVEHPILKNKLTRLRNIETKTAEFRRELTEISRILAFEVTRDIHLKETKIKTPLEETTGYEIDENPIIVSIMRAGNGMVDGMLSMLPFASVGHIGIYRDKKLKTTVEYYFRLPPDPEGKKIFLLDPMFATGDTAIAAIERLKEYDVGPIKLICIICSPEGLKKLEETYPDVEVYTLSIERELNKSGYILPGLGDAGDRLYNTI